MTPRTPTTAAGRRTDAWLYLRAYLIGAVNGGLPQTVADSIIEYVDAIAAEARAEPRAERLDRSKPCPGDLLCCRYQGHDGEHLSPVTWSQYAALEEPTPSQSDYDDYLDGMADHD